MTLPNFLVIGAAKSGTTALYHYLGQHPQVYVGPNKETNFFAFEGHKVDFRGPGDEEFCRSTITTLSAYEEQFGAVTDEVAIGEVSPWYLYSGRAAENIRRRIPDAKLIVVLRNPVDRAFSSYLHVVRDGREDLTFEEGLLAEKRRISEGWEFIWHYRRAGLYASQVGKFLDLFPREQIRFYLYDDLSADPAHFVEDVCEFLGVASDFVIDTSLKHNATGVPKNQLLSRLVLQPNPLKSAVKAVTPDRLRYNVGQRIKQRLIRRPSLSKETREGLIDGYRADILVLQDLIRKDLNHWLVEA